MTDWVIFRNTITNTVICAPAKDWHSWEASTNYRGPQRRYELVARVPTKAEAMRLINLTKEVDDGRKD
jgi:hypothetical protein